MPLREGQAKKTLRGPIERSDDFTHAASEVGWGSAGVRGHRVDCHGGAMWEFGFELGLRRLCGPGVGSPVTVEYGDLGVGSRRRVSRL
jgi:hypothetical protein